MKIPDRECPNFWENCEDCEFAMNVTCPKIIEERAELKKIADETEVKSIKKAHEDAQRIKDKYSSDPQRLIKASPKTFWGWWGATSPVDPQNVTREVILPLGGPVAFGGGSNNGRKAKKPNKMPEYLKTWGL